MRLSFKDKVINWLRYLLADRRQWVNYKLNNKKVRLRLTKWDIFK